MRSVYLSFPALALLLGFVVVVARHMTLYNMGCNAMVVPDEPVRQSGAGKAGFRLRKNTLLRPSVHANEQAAPGETNLNRSWPLDIGPLVEPHIFRQDFGSDFHRRFLVVGGLADP